MKTSLVTFVFCVLFSFYCFPQKNICIGERHTIHSNVLDEKREYWLYLPESYATEKEKSYPVIYLLDAGSFFHYLVGVQRAYSQARIPVMNECIIVGLLSGERVKDFTPTKSAYQRDGTLLPPEKAIGGESERFTVFLIEELRAEINGKYRTNSKNTLIGHSYGGLFVLTTLSYHSEMFSSYVAFDPSLWWDNMFIVRQAEAVLANRDLSGISLYLGFGEKMRPDQNNSLFLSSTNYFRKEILPLAKKQGLTVTDKSFPDDNHGTITLSGLLDAFKILPI